MHMTSQNPFLFLDKSHSFYDILDECDSFTTLSPMENLCNLWRETNLLSSAFSLLLCNVCEYHRAAICLSPTNFEAIAKEIFKK